MKLRAFGCQWVIKHYRWCEFWENIWTYGFVWKWCISYSNGLSPCSPLKLLFVGIPYFQTNPYEGHSSTMWGKERWCLQWNTRRTGRNSLHLNLQNLRSSINVWGTSVFLKIYLVYFGGPTPLPLPGGIPRAMREHHRTFFFVAFRRRTCFTCEYVFKQDDINYCLSMHDMQVLYTIPAEHTHMYIYT